MSLFKLPKAANSKFRVSNQKLATKEYVTWHNGHMPHMSITVLEGVTVENL